jgi:hypothetical protein
MEIMLAEEFIAILKEYGHNVYLQRRKLENESGPYRMVANGRYNPVIEKWTTYRWFPGARMNVRKDRLTPLGLVDGIDGIFYFQPEAQIKNGDLIYEETPHERTVQNIYRIENAIPYYLGEQLVYMAGHIKKMSPIS